MAIQTYQSRPAAGQLMLEGLVGGLGSAAGQQIGRGLGALVGMGAEKVGLTGPSQQEIDLLKNMGLSEEQARGFHKLDPRAQQQILANLAERQKIAKASSAYGTLDGKIAQKETSDQDLQNQMLQEGITVQDMQDLMQSRKEYPGGVKPEFMETPHDIYRNLTTAGLNPKEAKDFSNLYGDEYKERSKEAKDFVKQHKNIQPLKEEEAQFKRIYKLASEGKFSSPSVVNLSHGIEKFFGLNEGDLNSLLGADAEEASKILTDTLRNAKQYFGARMTDADLSAWFRRLPSLIQSDEGKLRALNDLLLMNEGSQLTGKAVKDILKQTGGKIPVNIEDMVEARVGDKLDNIYKKFIAGESNLPNYQKNLEKAEKKSAQERKGSAIGGTIGAGVGGLGSALVGQTIGRAAGGLLGSAGGPAGTLLGAAGGGYLGSKLGGLAGSAAGSEIAKLLGDLYG